MMRFDTKYGDGIPIQCHLGDLRTGGQEESHFELVRYGMGIISFHLADVSYDTYRIVR